MGLRKRAVRSVLWVLAQQWGRQLINLVMIGILSRLVGAVEFGLIALAVSILDFFKTFQDQGFSQAIVQLKDLDEDHLNTAFWTNVGSSVLLTVVGYMIAAPLATLFKIPALKPVIEVMSIQIISFGLVSTQIALINREMRFQVLAVRSFITTSISGVVGIGLALLGFGVWSLVARVLTSAAINVIVIWTASRWRPKFSFSFIHFKELFSFGINMLGSSLLDKIRRNADNFLIGLFFDTVTLGYYSIGFKLIDLLQKVILGVFRTVSLPVFAEVQSDRERLSLGYFDATRLTSMVFFSGFICLILLASPIISIVFGPDWGKSVEIMQWLAVFSLIGILSTFNQSVMISTGHPNWAFITNLGGSVLSIIGIIIGAQFGVVEVAIGKSIAGLLIFPISFSLVLKILEKKITFVIKLFAPILVASAIMAGGLGLIIGLLQGSPPYITVIVGGGVSVTLYLVSLYLIEKDVLIRGYELLRLPVQGKFKGIMGNE